jgi:transposase InsO family protein
MKYGVAMNTYGLIVPGLGRIRKTPTLSKAAKQRLKWLDFYYSHGRNARLTCRHFGLSPDVFYRWKRRYNRGDLRTLEDLKSRRPKHTRSPKTDPELVARVKALREQYPRWGKKKLYVMVSREGFTTCESTVGRILNRLRARGILNEPAIVTARLAGKKRSQLSKRPYAKRRDWDYVPKVPGDLVQVDTLHVGILEGHKRYQFTASDYISKFTARAVGQNITSTAASRIVEAIFDRLPVKPRAIQVDGGSEFMAVFEKTCQIKGIILYVLPPHSPKLNGVVERMNRTSREEIYDLGLHSLTNIAEHDQLLKDQDYIYNNIRPHEALGMKTPCEYYESIK